MRARYHIAAFVVVALVAPLVAFGASDDSGPDRYTAAVSPTGVLPSQSASYAIALKNHPRSTDSASAAEIDIPTGFSIDSSPVATASCPTATTWGAVLDAANSKIVATAPDGGALCPAGTLTVSFSATAPSAEGVYTWTTQLEGASTTFALSSVPPATVVDGTPPDSSIEAAPNDPSGVASASFSFSGDDGSGTGVAGFECELDGAGFAPCTSPRAYASLPDGSHTFEVRAHDGVGNTDATPATVEWTVDTTAPETTIDAAPADPSGVASASFSFSGGDGSGTGIAGFDCQLDGAGFAPCTSPQVYASLPDGSHTFEVRARDAAGNVDPTPASLTWLIDTAHPVVTLAEKPPALTNRTSAVFSFSSSKPGSTFECKLDAATFGPCDSPRAYDALADGAHTFTVRATALGNTGPPTTYSWTIDATAPQTAITTEPPTTSTSGSATFAFTSSEGGSTFLCSLDAGGFAPCASPKTYDGLGDGDHTFRAQAVDAAGNVDASPATYTWRITAVGPETADHTPPGNVVSLRRAVGYGTLKLVWTRPADTDFDHVAVLVSTSAKSPAGAVVYQGPASAYTARHFRNGVYYRYRIVSYDHASNASRGASIVVPPSALLRAPRDGSIVGRPPSLVWAPVPKATFYNVQLYHGARKVLSTWPNATRLGLTHTWSYSGRHFALERGAYKWYVWPAFGPRTKFRYGQLLGQGTFTFR
jgi:hypothetical protein